jgi:hypothetical protein
MFFIQSGFGNRTTVGHSTCHAVAAILYFVAAFTVAFALHIYLPPGVNLGLYFAIVHLLLIYLHIPPTRLVARDALRHALGSPCLEIWG